MCWPLILGTLLGGSALSAIGNHQAASAQMAASNAERARQQALTQQQNALVDRSIANTGNITNGGLDAAIAARKAGIDASLATASPTQGFLPGSSTADASVGRSGAQIVGKEKALTGGLADASARMNGLGDSLFTTNIANNRDAQGVNQIGAAKMDSASVLPYELQAAAQKGAFLRGLGQLASTIGGMAAGGGFGGGSGAAANAYASSGGAIANPGSAIFNVG